MPHCQAIYRLIFQFHVKNKEQKKNIRTKFPIIRALDEHLMVCTCHNFLSSLCCPRRISSPALCAWWTENTSGVTSYLVAGISSGSEKEKKMIRLLPRLKRSIEIKCTFKITTATQLSQFSASNAHCIWEIGRWYIQFHNELPFLSILCVTWHNLCVVSLKRIRHSYTGGGVNHVCDALGGTGTNPIFSPFGGVYTVSLLVYWPFFLWLFWWWNGDECENHVS